MDPTQIGAPPNNPARERPAALRDASRADSSDVPGPESRDAFRRRLDDVIRRGRRTGAMLRAAPDDRDALAGARIWQHDCEAIVTALSGGSKSHWLSRAYSDALLVRHDGLALERADVADIVDRIAGVLEQAARSLDTQSAGWRPDEPPAPHRFDFVHDRDLRPVLEAAYGESRDALERRELERALATTCGILEAIITDALAHARTAESAAIAAMSFDDRIAAAEGAGLITGACARLPLSARRYRDAIEPSDSDARSSPPLRRAVAREDAAVLERTARVAGQVLHVVMRDLNPGR
jgi:hypothetical protein